jgi:hypothetical protein
VNGACEAWPSDRVRDAEALGLFAIGADLALAIELERLAGFVDVLAPQNADLAQQAGELRTV